MRTTMATQVASWTGSLAYVAATLAVGLSLVACEDAKRPARTPEATTGTGTATEQANANATANAGAGGDSSPVSVDERIRTMCSLPTANFDFDSSRVTTTAEQALSAIATCFTTGPGKGKGLRVVGHADPRGETTYNFALGQQRAGSIAGHISRLGVEKSRIATSSRGELEATGTDDPTWARDRKVEIYLAD